MKFNKKLLAGLTVAAFSLGVTAQEQVQGFVHEQSEAADYVWPADKAVLAKLDKWQDLKFGVRTGTANGFGILTSPRPTQSYRHAV